MPYIPDIEDARRTEPAFVLDERAMLESWLEFHQWTLLIKCEGLTDEQRKARPVPTSLLSLHGLVRHMADVERNWFRRVVAGQELRHLLDYSSNEDADFDVADADWDTDLDTWRAECEAARQAVADLDLDHTGLRRGEAVSLRWAYNHMIEEYARHNGHADLLRELVDGAVGC